MGAKEVRESRDNETKQSRPRTSRAKSIIARVEQIAIEDHRLGVHDIVSTLGISVGSVEPILHDELKMRFFKLSPTNADQRTHICAIGNFSADVDT